MAAPIQRGVVRPGVANIVSPLFGGLPATGAHRADCNSIRAGAQTPIAGIIHSFTLLCIVLFASPLVRSCDGRAGGILMVVSYTWASGAKSRSCSSSRRLISAVWLVTFALTVFADLTVAVEAGMILAALLFINRVAGTTTVSQVTVTMWRWARAYPAR